MQIIKLLFQNKPFETELLLKYRVIFKEQEKRNIGYPLLLEWNSMAIKRERGIALLKLGYKWFGLEKVHDGEQADVEERGNYKKIKVWGKKCLKESLKTGFEEKKSKRNITSLLPLFSLESYFSVTREKVTVSHSYRHKAADGMDWII